MSDNIIDSYLVRLGTVIDAPGWNKFNSTLRAAEKTVFSSSTAIVKDFFKIEVGLIGMFATVGTGIIAIADKTAMADQQYRLFGMRMLMTKDSARAMQMSMDELGASLDEIAYDPELNKRFQYLYEQNIKLGKTLGPTFDKNMIAVRGLRTEYKLFGDEVEILTMGAISKLFEKTGYGSNELLSNLDKLTDKFMENIPQWTDEISDKFLPVWRSVEAVGESTVGTIKQVIGQFTNLSGILLGDSSIQDTTFNIQNLSKALGEWFDKLTQIALTTGLITKTGLHFGGAIVNKVHEWALEGPMMSAGSPEALAAKAQADKEANAVAQNFKSAFTGNWDGNPDFDAFNKYLNGPTVKTSQVPSDLKGGLSNPDFLRLLHGIAMTESGDRQFDINGRPVLGQPNATGELAVGRFQMLPSTAKHYGIDPSNDQQNTLGGAMYLRDLLNKHKGNVHDALADYGGFRTKSPDDYINKVEKYGFQSGYDPGSKGDVIIQQLNIHVPKHLPENQWEDFIKRSAKDLNAQALKSNIAETAAGAYF